MKNEKVVLTDEEKMKKNFKAYGKIAEVIESILLIAPIIILVILAVIGIGILIGNEQDNVQESFMLQSLTGEDVSWNQILKEVVGEGEQEFEEMSNAMIAIKVICIIADYIITILILDNLKKMFKETSQEAKPFTEANVKRLNNISWLTFAMWIIINNNVGLMAVLSIFALNKVFKYGYKLQIESDETL